MLAAETRGHLPRTVLVRGRNKTIIESLVKKGASSLGCRLGSALAATPQDWSRLAVSSPLEGNGVTAGMGSGRVVHLGPVGMASCSETLKVDCWPTATGSCLYAEGG